MFLICVFFHVYNYIERSAKSAFLEVQIWHLQKCKICTSGSEVLLTFRLYSRMQRIHVDVPESLAFDGHVAALGEFLNKGDDAAL